MEEGNRTFLGELTGHDQIAVLVSEVVYSLSSALSKSFGENVSQKWVYTLDWVTPQFKATGGLL